MLGTSLAGLPAFLVYFGVSAAIVVAYLFIYTRITPHDEFGLIRENVPAAAIALGLSLLGLCCRWQAQSRTPATSSSAWCGV